MLFIQASQGLLYKMYIFDLNEPIPHVAGRGFLLPEINDRTFNARSVERGARIVTVSGFKVILQMPRGNIETLYPRLLMFKALREMLSADPPSYHQAFRMVR